MTCVLHFAFPCSEFLPCSVSLLISASRAKLLLYASLHNAVASHKSTLSERDKMLTEARESLVKEGGAVVGGGGSAAASALRSESSAPGE